MPIETWAEPVVRPAPAFPRPRVRAPEPLRRAIARLAAAGLGFPIAVGVLSRLYSTILLAAVPLFEPEHHAPRLTGFKIPFLAWDSQWYLTIAHFGYHADAMQAGPNGGRHDFAFYPAWPTLLRGFEQFGVPGSISGPVLAALLFIAACVVLFVVMRREFGDHAAKWGIVLLAFSPTAYVMSMAYSEPLFLFLTGMYFLRPNSRLRPILGGAIVLTRIAGVAIGVAAGVRWLRNWRDWRPLAVALGVTLAFGAWWAFIAYLTGDPGGWFQGSAAWGHVLGIPAIVDSFVKLDNRKIGAFLFTLVILAASVGVLRRNVELGVYCLVAVVLSILGAPVESMPRHALAAFPAFAILAIRFGRRG